jgi:hypothetical protein
MFKPHLARIATAILMLAACALGVMGAGTLPVSVARPAGSAALPTARIKASHRATSARQSLASRLAPTSTTASFSDPFTKIGVLQEAGSPTESTSGSWWLNSGAELIGTASCARTLAVGDTVPASWVSSYVASNATDTDNGTRPQNIFRLFTRSKWLQSQETCYYRATYYDVSASPQRYNPNGLLLLSRFQDGQNTYYAGIRVDGDAVIKKKVAGVYTTLAESKVFPGIYDRDANPNLLPMNTWLGLRLVTRTVGNAVTLQLQADLQNTGAFSTLLSAIDDGSAGGPALVNAGSGGLRTDFMDVQFRDYREVALP